MNEKRFVIDMTEIGGDCVQFGIIDSLDDTYFGEIEKICDCLNSLNEKNEKLKKENERLKHQVILAQKGRNMYMNKLFRR